MRCIRNLPSPMTDIKVDLKKIELHKDFYKETDYYVKDVPKEDLRVPPGGINYAGITILGIFG
jgi:hypothetical protein